MDASTGGHRRAAGRDDVAVISAELHAEIVRLSGNRLLD
jgi:hypothetical protein